MTGPYDKGKGVKRPDELTPEQIDRARDTVRRQAKDPKEADELMDELGLKNEEEER